MSTPRMGSYPDGRRVERPERPANYVGTWRVLPEADKDNIAFAEKHWLRATEEDFDHQGKLWVDRATGVAYKRIRANPLLADDPTTTGVSCFLVAGTAEDASLIFLRQADAPDPAVERRVLGAVGGRMAEPSEPAGQSGIRIY